MRTHLCGVLTADQIGQTVSLCGWVATRREHGEHLAFVDVRDHSGVTQCVVDNSVDVRAEYVVRVTGTVRPGEVFIPFHWDERCANRLTDDQFDPISREPNYKQCAVQIEPIDSLA